MAKVEILTKEQRHEAGKALREKCPRKSHDDVVLGQGERDVIALIESSNEDRLENLIPVRHGRMVQSAFAYFRGTALIQAHDLKGTPSSGIIVHSCGDCHLMNFGGFATPERNIVFDINDFDETLPAPFEWDLKRLAVSFVIAARWRGFTDVQAREMAVQTAASYRKSMRKRETTGVLEGWYSRTTVSDLQALAAEVGDKIDLSGRLKKKLAEARKSTHEHVFHNLTTPSRGLPRIVDQPPLIYHTQLLNEREVAVVFRQYRETLAEERRILFDRFKLVDWAIKVVGVGSVGTRCIVALLLAAPDDPLFLQFKEARPSVLERLYRTCTRTTQWPTRRRRATPDAVCERHLPGLVQGTPRSRRLRPPAPRHEGFGRYRNSAAEGDARVCNALRAGAGASARQSR